MSTLVYWVHDHQKNGQESFPGKGSLKPSEAEYAQLRKELAVTREERDILKKALGIFICSPQMKYQFMQAHAQEFSVERMSKVFKVSRSGYYRFVSAKPSQRALDNQQLLSKIAVIHEASRQTYGSPRVHAELRANGEKFSRNRVCKLIQSAGIVAKMRKRFKVTTRRNPEAVGAPSLLNYEKAGGFSEK